MDSGQRHPSSRQPSTRSNMTVFYQIVMLGVSACLISSAHAVKQGHARLVSATGSPLEIVLPISELTTEDQQALKVEVAGSSLWSQAGLKPPVPLETLRVSVQPGARPDTRTVVLQSSQASTQSVVDVLLTLATSSGTRQLQVSLLQPELAPVSLATSSALVRVRPGDTLYGIAQRNLVPGATIHQMLWALFDANPSAFIAENMNLLRAGAVLNIPDAKTVLAIDPAMARARFTEHDSRFRSLRGKSAAAAGKPPVVGASSASSGKLSQSSSTSAQQQPAEDRLRLSTSESDRQADLQSSQKREIAENQARVGELQQNIQQMKDALGQGAVSTGGPKPDTQAGLSSSSSTAGGVPSPGVNMGANSAASAASPSSVKASSDPTVSPNSASSGNPGNASAPGAVGTGANSVAAQSSKVEGHPSASESGQKEGAAMLTQWVKDNLLVVITALLALLAFLVGMRMRRNSSRRDDESEDADASAQMSPAARSAFERKLQSIDLSLDSPESASADIHKSKQT